MQIKIRQMFIIVTAVIIGTAVLSAPAPGQKTSLSIKLLKETIQSGDAVYLRITEKNLTNVQLSRDYFAVNGVDTTYDYYVQDQAGNEVPEKRIPPVGSFWTLRIPPGREESRPQFIGWMFDFTKPGNYDITASEKEEIGVARSNTVTPTVTK
jgi:hypothetical protein